MAEVGSWVAVSCLEAMVETAAATRALSLSEVVVRLASGLRKMPRVVSGAEQRRARGREGESKGGRVAVMLFT